MLFVVAPTIFRFSLDARISGNFGYSPQGGVERRKKSTHMENCCGRKSTFSSFAFRFLLKYDFVRTVVLSVIKKTHTLSAQSASARCGRHRLTVDTHASAVICVEYNKFLSRLCGERWNYPMPCRARRAPGRHLCLKWRTVATFKLRHLNW